MKPCTKCGVLKSFQGFAQDKNRKDGLNPWCKGCVNFYKKSWLKNRARKSFFLARDRCQNPNNNMYARYGGRGIRFEIPSWKDLIESIGERPVGCSLDRINPDGHYTLRNIRWATYAEQSQNSSNAKLNPEDVLQIREMGKQGFTLKHIADKFHVTPANIHVIIKHKTWKNICL